MKVLCVIDMQNDFVDGSLGSKEAQAIVNNVVEKINSFNGLIFVTRDTHDYHYLVNTLEGQKLPVIHCLRDTYGWELNDSVKRALQDKPCEYIEKCTFGSSSLMTRLRLLHSIESIEFCGLCTDICVVSNALLCRASLPNTPISVDATCCAGTSPEKHKAALEVMKSCQIDIINE